MSLNTIVSELALLIVQNILQEISARELKALVGFWNNTILCAFLFCWGFSFLILFQVLIEDEERFLALTILKFPDVVEAVVQVEPELFCQHYHVMANSDKFLYRNFSHHAFATTHTTYVLPSMSSMVPARLILFFFHFVKCRTTSFSHLHHRSLGVQKRLLVWYYAKQPRFLCGSRSTFSASCLLIDCRALLDFLQTLGKIICDQPGCLSLNET